jgi:nicotinate phosphoribosyltransferase
MEGTTRFPLIPEVISGETADVYFLRVRDVLRDVGRDPVVGMEVFCRDDALLCGVQQVVQILSDAGFDGEVWSLDDGDAIAAREAVMQIRGRYSAFGIYETAYLGALASSTGWATAAREVIAAAGDVPVTSFGARHVHPNISGLMDYASIVGGCVACSTPLGSRLAGTVPSGTMPHAFVLVEGDTVTAARDFDRVMPSDVPRIVLVDTFTDEAVESLRVAEALGGALQGIRLDTPAERGGVTPGLVAEVRARLDMAGFEQVQIMVSGGMNPERIRQFRERGARVDGYGVGSYIAHAPAIDFTADIHEIDGRPVAKRGRVPGMRQADRLHRVL